ncbi:uncharacterized protein [Montipora foliosa]|uniref:uncharacterized protein n=1 Tax=Montipora foliosa TaxID=591990 RepID=UPI0035F1A3DA
MLLFAVFIVLSASQCCSADSKVQMPYYQLFTPLKLVKAASFIHHHNSVTATKLTFLGAPENYARLMTVPLIPPGAIDRNANLVVKLAIGLDKEIGLGESDPSYVISDGQFFFGALILDKNNYKTDAPCVGVKGKSGEIGHRYNSKLPKPFETFYPGRFEIWLNLSERWGTCFVPVDGGLSREMLFQHKLNPNNGLFLEVYTDDKTEKTGIKYIEVTIVQEK